ncbi:SDR family oxidoreductase [Actinotalea sp. M2MS4P-6]|uniref:SDR family oxidoreductase n=1 Tax=Actinotalea sp. M2MS4P-6 TaxID=2983762 RepID=UPI0021E3D4E5|nr:SDR family oxidoreductase [Actinotalea sp. M2MS4P-6]MCV2392738.1 SDR family oxidoreductase [Actinotalea sp. M2MS4P-6]
MRIGITGATGHIGGMVAAELAEEGFSQRLLVRDAHQAPVLDCSEIRQVAYGGDATDALRGVRALLMVSAHESPDRVAEHRAFIEDAAEAGVEHVVYTSFEGAGSDATFTLARDHGATEEILKASGMSWTFLRDNLYLDLVPYFANDQGVLRGPAGSGRFAGVARADVAAVAATVLRDPARHAGRTYRLTGPEALTLDDVTRVWTEVTGRVLSYEPESVADAYAWRRATGAEEWQVEAWVSTYLAIASGEMAEVTGDVERLLGRPPRSLADVLRAQTAS